MFSQSVLHCPTDEKALARIRGEIASFRCAAAVKYIESLGLSDAQTEALLDSLTAEAAARCHIAAGS